jgi:phage FluMu protein Com
LRLIRCNSCRYSFERADDDTRRECPQCGTVLQSAAPEPPSEAIEDRKTRKIHIIPKPEE